MTSFSVDIPLGHACADFLVMDLKSKSKFINMPQSKRRRRAPSTDKCFVKQVAGLDYTEPSIEIAVSASDDKSQPTLMLYAGTSPGLKNLLETEMGGSSTTITQVRELTHLSHVSHILDAV